MVDTRKERSGRPAGQEHRATQADHPELQQPGGGRPTEAAKDQDVDTAGTTGDQKRPLADTRELVDTGVGRDHPEQVDVLTREEGEEDPGEATRKLPKNEEAV